MSNAADIGILNVALGQRTWAINAYQRVPPACCRSRCSTSVSGSVIRRIADALLPPSSSVASRSKKKKLDDYAGGAQRRSALRARRCGRPLAHSELVLPMHYLGCHPVVPGHGAQGRCSTRGRQNDALDCALTQCARSASPRRSVDVDVISFARSSVDDRLPADSSFLPIVPGIHG